VLHKNVTPPADVSNAESPIQMVCGGHIAQIGPGVTVTVAEHELVHPSASVTVTVYVVVAEGLTVIEAVVALVLHRNDTPPDAVRVDESPTQIDELELAMLHTGSGLTVMVNESVAVFPQASDAVITTVVTPTGNASPETGTLLTVTGPGQLSVAEILKVTMLSHAPATISAGAAIDGAIVSVVQVKV
jgi:hypothetical protein